MPVLHPTAGGSTPLRYLMTVTRYEGRKLDSFPRQKGSGIAPVGYEYREYKNWRGIPKPRRCPFCKKAKGEIRRKSSGFSGVCPNCGATGPKRESYDGALRAWNGKG